MLSIDMNSTRKAHGIEMLHYFLLNIYNKTKSGIVIKSEIFSNGKLFSFWQIITRNLFTEMTLGLLK